METTVINESYPGIVKDGHLFRFAGSISVTGYLKIELDALLIVSGGIKAGEGIKAGGGIEAGFSILAKVIVGLRIFAGLCLWKKPEPDEMKIVAERVEGDVCYGTVEKLPVVKS